MKNIEFVKGILITPDGQKHPFGKQSYESVKNLKKEKQPQLAKNSRCSRRILHFINFRI